MSSTLGIGVPVPKMLPIVGTWALPFTAYYAFLANRVLNDRLQTKKFIGDRSSETSATTGGKDKLQIDVRCQNNFAEYVPLAFILAATAELNGANRKVLNYAMAALLALRVAHAEFGLQGEGAAAWGRPLGHFGTQAFLAGIAGYGAYLIKGYWGF